MFRNFYNLNRLFRELNFFEDPFEGLHNPSINGKENIESGSDENGNWEKKTFRSDDGMFSYTIITSNSKTPNKRDEISDLKIRLENLIEQQEFEKACELRDKIKKLESNKKELDSLNKELSESIKNQDYEKCIELRDKINSLK